MKKKADDEAAASYGDNYPDGLTPLQIVGHANQEKGYPPTSSAQRGGAGHPPLPYPERKDLPYV